MISVTIIGYTGHILAERFPFQSFDEAERLARKILDEGYGVRADIKDDYALKKIIYKKDKP